MFIKLPSGQIFNTALIAHVGKPHTVTLESDKIETRLGVYLAGGNVVTIINNDAEALGIYLDSVSIKLE